MIIVIILFTLGVSYEMFSDAEPVQLKQQQARYEKEHGQDKK